MTRPGRPGPRQRKWPSGLISKRDWPSSRPATATVVGDHRLCGRSFLELLLHRLGQVVDAAHRANVDGHVVDLALIVEVQEVDPLELAVSHPRAETERRRIAGL